MSISESPAPSARKPAVDLAVLAASVPLLAAAVRIWLFSNGDPVVLRKLVSTLDIQALLIGTGILITPGMVFFSAAIMLMNWQVRDRFNEWRSHNPWSKFIGPPLIVIVIATTPTTLLLRQVAILLGFILVYAIIKRYWAWGTRRILDVAIAPRGTDPGSEWVSILVVFVLYSLSSGVTMWLPLEKVESADADQVSHIGYVLESDEIWTTVLTESGDLITLHTRDVDSRTYCAERGARSGDSLVLDQQEATSRVDCPASTGEQSPEPQTDS